MQATYWGAMTAGQFASCLECASRLFDCLVLCFPTNPHGRIPMDVSRTGLSATNDNPNREFKVSYHTYRRGRKQRKPQFVRSASVEPQSVR